MPKIIDEKLAPFADRLNRLRPSERETVTSAIRRIASNSVLQDAELDSLINAILSAWEHGGLREILARIPTLSDTDSGLLLSVMGEANVLAALHIAEVIKTKIDLVCGLRKRIEARELENVIRNYIADHPWLIQPDLEFYHKEISLNKILGEVATAIKINDHPDFSKRIDLLLADSHDGHLALIEFMRPGVKLDRDHIDRFTHYVDELRGRTLASTGGTFRRITGTLVADRLERTPGNVEALRRLLDSDMFAIEWELLIANAEREYRDYLNIFG